MSCVYRALPRIIPNLLFSARKGASVAIVSPWIQDVILRVPAIRIDGHSNSREMYLSQFLEYLAISRQLKIFIAVRDNDYRVQYATRLIRRRMGVFLRVHTIQHLHAKAVVTNNAVLLTSANVIPTSLYRNVESCQLLPNQYQSTVRYLEYEYGVKIGN